MTQLEGTAGLALSTRVLLTLASAGVAAWAISSARGIVAPLLLAAIIVIVVHPARHPLDRRGAPRWVGTTVVVVIAYAVLATLAVVVVIALGQFAQILSTYDDELKQGSANLTDFLGTLGFDPKAATLVTDQMRPDAILPLMFAAGMHLLGAGAALFFVLGYALFMAIDASRLHDLPEHLVRSGSNVVRGFQDLAASTSRYFVVNSIFGAIVAVIDGLLLWAVGVPAPFLWAVLAFVTNYIPTVGFVIGVIPPALLALVTGGWDLALLVVAIYCVVNVVLQVLIQPQFVSRTVRLGVTLTFLSVVLWTAVLGPIGAILAVPSTLLARWLLIGGHAGGGFARWLTGDSRVTVTPDREDQLRTPE